jgi:hypothetical protein
MPNETLRKLKEMVDEYGPTVGKYVFIATSSLSLSTIPIGFAQFCGYTVDTRTVLQSIISATSQEIVQHTCGPAARAIGWRINCGPMASLDNGPG